MNETEELLSFFASSHLVEPLRAVSQPFCDLAHALCRQVIPCNQRLFSLQHLLIAKDAAVRAAIQTPHATPKPRETP